MMEPKPRSLPNVDGAVPVHVVRDLGEDHDLLARGLVDPRDSLLFAVGAAIQRAEKAPLCSRLTDSDEYEDAMARLVSSAGRDFLCVAAPPSLDVIARSRESVEMRARAGVRFRVLRYAGEGDAASASLGGIVAFRSRTLLNYEPSRITLAVVDDESMLLARTGGERWTRSGGTGLGFVATDPTIVATFRDLLEAYWVEAAPRAGAHG